MANIADKLNVHLADWNILYTKLHHYHWYVTGPHFLALHAKFEELYDFAAESLDDVAERILAIGGKPISSLKQYLSQGTLAEAGNETTDTQMLQAVINDFRKLADSMRQTAKQADESGDAVTSDFLNGLVEKLQKQIWILSATAKGLPVGV
ncbi:DNA starvation/stationary phase protection protein [Cohnella lubricantis]|uniref:DNA starvation/stationary phase protection protein n=1 Tax=Cohnella lubricantis TaxID=2163172 RepID=A0A841T9P0_9BACL|nr:DNA starvation/stationary phase protection protein [Cohnella lubricantis]MBB6676769.1 DNA starvation/stationary phase protection protein [Cohnella lubricantis]MBP2117815.1 starvation-inducible DNA-binding protein [Cohnella lubricantis]